MSDFTIVAFYRFTHLPDFEAIKQPLFDVCTRSEAFGTILLAEEGINGTIAGPPAGIDAVITYIRNLPGCDETDLKWSFADENPFLRMKVRLKKEIVTMGIPQIDAASSAGEYIEPEDWNDLIDDPDVVVIDTRNDYEVGIGTFDGALNPETTSFREFPDWLKAKSNDIKQSKVAMFCTGGIRCEKSTAYAKSLGFKDVFHLKGGILNYLEKVPEDDSRWHGECFVFDQRVSVGHDLAPGSYDMCHACRTPLTEEDQSSSFYEPGVSCPHCHDNRSPEQRQRYLERQRQIEHAKSRGEKHLGSTAQPRRAK